ncbi:MAG: HNH endonuclease [Clostridia bacterium]|jgi:rubrerythrin|nr:HNH endonuclease [Clostridia bacterium]
MVVVVIVAILIIVSVVVAGSRYSELEKEVFKELGISSWKIYPEIDACVTVKSRQALENYDDIKFFKEHKEKLIEAENIILRKTEMSEKLKAFIENNEYRERTLYNRIETNIDNILKEEIAYRIRVSYISSAGNNLGQKEILVDKDDIDELKNNPSLLMGKGEYNKYLKEQQKEALNQKQHDYYEKVNSIIEYANKNKDALIIKGSQGKLDNLIAKLFDKTVNSIKKIKTIDSEEWGIIGSFIAQIDDGVKEIISENDKILAYYESPDFLKVKETCDVLMSTQREFNEYISEKVESISTLFGTRVVRNETVIDDDYGYIRPYKKTITPFTAEVSATVFASAENNPLEYVVKYFYPNKKMYPEQIRKLQLLVEELETLKDAKQIIENYKKEYQQYIVDVPEFVMKNDEDGFYSRLGFANIDEGVLTVEYKFVYTSNGGMAQRSFTVPMTEETVIELVNTLESKLAMSALAKEQRALMTKKLREYIKKRDNYTCCTCGNSTHAEPNLLLEIDHIIPVAKGGLTEESNLQTLCWKCNRSKSDKVL